MKLVIVADPLARLKPAGDSTLAFLREALRRRHSAYWVTEDGLEYRDGSVRVEAVACLECVADGLPRVGPAQTLWLRDVQAVFVRKDPPFNDTYLRLCWLLAMEEPRVFMFNRPSLLLRYHEKLLPFEALAQGFLTTDDLIPTHIGTLTAAKTYVREKAIDKVISKPFLGFGGTRVELRSAVDFEGWHPSEREKEELVVQPFDPTILKRGDRRVFFLDGKRIGDFVRMPAHGGFISNLAQGGTAVAEPLHPKEIAVLDKLGQFLKHAGIAFAGADLIGPKISEVNVTSPTGIRSLEKLEKRDISKDVFDWLESKIK